MDIFYVKLLLSFIVGGGLIALSIRIAEKLGSKAGGIFLSLPSTSLVSLLFIAWTNSNHAAIEASAIMPIVLSASTVFIVSYVHFFKRLGNYSIPLSLIIWALVILPFIAIKIDNLLLSLLVSAPIFAFSMFILRGYESKKIPQIKIRKREYAIRWLFSGLIVSIAVILSKFLGPLWGGMFASFPAAFSTSFYFLTKRHGIEFAASTGKAMTFGILNVIPFVIVFYYGVPAFGLVAGTLFAYLISLFAAFFIFRLTK
ncbi:MAG: DUF3147 family protein [Candidatus Micrarchaeota archaeon]